MGLWLQHELLVAFAGGSIEAGQNTVLKFPTNALPAHIDEFLVSLEQGGEQPLWMPVKLSHGGALGAAPQAVQAIATWAQGQTHRVIHLARPYGTSVDTQNRFARTLPGMTALYFAERVESGQIAQSRFEALQAVAPMVQAMDGGDLRSTVRGQAVALVCFAGARSEFLNTLYSKSAADSVRGISDFLELLKNLLQTMGGGLVNQLDAVQLGLLSSLVYQLFLNTDQHGAYDVSGKRYQAGVRGISVKLTSVNHPKELVDLAGDDVPLKSYLTKSAVVGGRTRAQLGPEDVPKIAGTAKPIRFIELSVFDTGPGMGLRWLSRKSGARSYADFAVGDELAAVRECFEKHATTKSVQSAGVGLSTAVSAMGKLNAFMTLRTGRMSLYQDFSTGVAQSDFVPKPRRPKGQSAPLIAGTGYTVCFRVS